MPEADGADDTGIFLALFMGRIWDGEYGLQLYLRRGVYSRQGIVRRIGA